MSYDFYPLNVSILSHAFISTQFILSSSISWIYTIISIFFQVNHFDFVESIV